MKVRVTLWPMVLLGSSAVVFWILAGSAIPQTAARQLSPDQCVVTVSGAIEPDILPAANVWENVFKRYVTEPKAQLSIETHERVHRTATTALAKADALRQSLVTADWGPGRALQVVRDREAAIADAFLNARDELARTLPTIEFDRLNDQVDEALSTMTVTLPTPGRIVARPDGTAYCRAAVRGDDFPHLIPEYKVWEAFLDAWASVATYNKTPNGSYPREYLLSVRRTSFRMSDTDLQLFLDAAIATAGEVERLHNTMPHESDQQARDAGLSIRHAVLHARWNLLRNLSPAGWLELQRGFERSRGDARWWYTSPVGNRAQGY